MFTHPLMITSLHRRNLRWPQTTVVLPMAHTRTYLLTQPHPHSLTHPHIHPPTFRADVLFVILILDYPSKSRYPETLGRIAVWVFGEWHTTEIYKDIALWLYNLYKRSNYLPWSTHEVYYLLNFSSYYTLTGSPHI